MSCDPHAPDALAGAGPRAVADRRIAGGRLWAEPRAGRSGVGDLRLEAERKPTAAGPHSSDSDRGLLRGGDVLAYVRGRSWQGLDPLVVCGGTHRGYSRLGLFRESRPMDCRRRGGTARFSDDGNQTALGAARRAGGDDRRSARRRHGLADRGRLHPVARQSGDHQPPIGGGWKI